MNFCFKNSPPLGVEKIKVGSAVDLSLVMASKASMLEAAERGDIRVSANAIPATQNSHIKQFMIHFPCNFWILEVASESNPPQLLEHTKFLMQTHD